MTWIDERNHALKIFTPEEIEEYQRNLTMNNGLVCTRRDSLFHTLSVKKLLKKADDGYLRTVMMQKDYKSNLCGVKNRQ